MFDGVRIKTSRIDDRSIADGVFCKVGRVVWI